MICGLCGCEKYLDEKPRQSLVVPSTLSDLEALLNNQNVVNTSVALNELVADNYYVDTEDWEALLSQAGNLPTFYDECMNYVWDSQAVHSSWNDAYKSSIYYTNVVLDALGEIQHHEPGRANSIEGAALFIRAFVWERLVQIYAKPYSRSPGNTRPAATGPRRSPSPAGRSSPCAGRRRRSGRGTGSGPRRARPAGRR